MRFIKLLFLIIILHICTAVTYHGQIDPAVSASSVTIPASIDYGTVASSVGIDTQYIPISLPYGTYAKILETTSSNLTKCYFPAGDVNLKTLQPGVSDSLAIIFSSATTGDINVNITIRHTGSNSPSIVNVTRDTQTLEFLAGTDTLDFGTVTEYTTADIILVNYATTNAYLTKVDSLEAPFSLVTTLPRYAYGDTTQTTLTFAFDPQTNATFTNTVELIYLESGFFGDTLEIVLTGVGSSISETPTLVVTEDPVDFGTVAGYTTATFAIYNSSDEDINITAMEGIATPFGRVSSLGWVYASSYKNMTLWFDPQSDATFRDTAHFIYTYEPYQDTLSVALLGIGSGTSPTAGEAPYNLLSTITGNTTTLTWLDDTPQTSNLSYIVQKSADNTTFTFADSVATLYYNGTFGYDTTQYFRVRSYNSGSDQYSDWSATTMVVWDEGLADVMPTAKSTFESISLYWDPDGAGSANIAEVWYRKKGGTLWREGHPMWFDPRTIQSNTITDFGHLFEPEYRGSIVYCSPDTTYEVFTYLSGSQRWGFVEIEMLDEVENWTIIDTTFIPDTSRYIITEGGSAATGYKLYTSNGARSVINSNYESITDYQGVLDIQASYVIVRNLEIMNIRNTGVYMEDSIHHVLLDSLYIHDYGMGHISYARGIFLGDADNDSASSIANNIVVQNCVVKDNTELYTNRYNNSGIVFGRHGGHTIIIRDNITGDSLGGSFHRYGIASEDYSYLGGYPDNCDIYNNRIFFASSAIEADGGLANVRIWNNYAHFCSWYSIAPVSRGPVYVFENIHDAFMEPQIFDTGEFYAYDDPALFSIYPKRGPMFKLGGKNKDGGYWYGSGMTYIYHNTNLQRDLGGYHPAGGKGGVSPMDGQPFNVVSKNNVFNSYRVGDGGDDDRRHVINDTYYPNYYDPSWTFVVPPDLTYGNQFDYDLIGGYVVTSENHPTYAKNVYEPNLVYVNAPSDVKFEDISIDYRLEANSPGWDQGIRIPNFNDGYSNNAPDMGADEPRTIEDEIPTIIPGAPVTDTFYVVGTNSDAYATGGNVYLDTDYLQVGSPADQTATASFIFSGVTERSNLKSAVLKLGTSNEVGTGTGGEGYTTELTDVRLNQPKNFTASSTSGTSIVLSWEWPSSVDIDGVRVYRSLTGNEPWIRATGDGGIGPTARTFTDTDGLVASTDYYYLIQPYDGGLSGPRALLSQTLKIQLGDATNGYPNDHYSPYNFVAVRNGNNIDLTWDWDPEGLTIVGFKLERRMNFGGWEGDEWTTSRRIANPDARSFTDVDVEPGIYIYRVFAYSGAQNYMFSENAEIETFGDVSGNSIANISFDFTSTIEYAPDSDLWPTTTDADGTVWVAWGDGSGLKPTYNATYKASIGFGTIQGHPSGTLFYTNVWGGEDALNPTEEPFIGPHRIGKPTGMAAIDGTLYCLVSMQEAAYTYATEQRLIYSTNGGANWSTTDVVWDLTGPFRPSTIVNYGDDYEDNTDGYVYMTGHDWNNPINYTEVFMSRVAKANILDLSAYEYFTGFEGTTATWSSTIANRVSILHEPDQIGALVIGWEKKWGVFYMTGHNTDWVGRWTMYEADAPYGPFRTVKKYTDWGGYASVGAGMQHSFPGPWINETGTEAWMIWSGALDTLTGIDYDKLQITKATLTLNSTGALTDPIAIRIDGYSAASVSAFTLDYSNFANRLLYPTSNNVTQSITDVWARNTYRTFNVTSIIQELFNDYSYSNSNLQLNVRDNGTLASYFRTLQSSDYGELVPMLIVTYDQDPALPVLTSPVVNSITDTSANFSVTVAPGDANSTVSLFIKDTAGASYDDFVLGTIASTQSLSQVVDTLTASTTYDYYFSVVNSYGSTGSTPAQFTTTGTGTINYDTLYITQGTDDAWIQTGKVNTTLALRIGRDTWNKDTVGVRFTGFTEQSGLQEAWLEVCAYGNDADSIHLSIWGEDVAAPTTFNTSVPGFRAKSYNPTTATFDTVITSANPWTDLTYYKLADVTDIVNELTTSYTYSNGSLCFFIGDNGTPVADRSRIGYAYENNSALTMRLILKYLN